MTVEVNKNLKVNHKILNICKKKENFPFKVKITENKMSHFSKENSLNKAQAKFYLIDAEGASIGRLAAFIVNLLKGKNKEIFTPNACAENYVIVKNCSLLKFSGNKMNDKIYYHHTGYAGGLKETKASIVAKKDSTKLLRLAVKGMLSKGPLGYKLQNQYLKLYSEDHNHQAQNPEVIDFLNLNKKNKIS